MSTFQQWVWGAQPKMSTFAVSASDFAPGVSLSFSEPQLVTLAKRGDSQAILNLFERNKKRVYSFTLRVVADVPRAETLTEEIFLSSFRKLSGLRNDAEFSTCLNRNAVDAVMRLRTTTSQDSPRYVCGEVVEANSRQFSQCGNDSKR